MHFLNHEFIPPEPRERVATVQPFSGVSVAEAFFTGIPGVSCEGGNCRAKRRAITPERDPQGPHQPT